MQSRNHYSTLGLSADGLNKKGKPYSQNEIKKAFRKKSREVHPDKNPNSAEEATKQFKLLNESYNILLGKEPHAISDSEPTTNSSEEKNFIEIVNRLDAGSISIHQLKEKFGWEKTLYFLENYFTHKGSYLRRWRRLLEGQWLVWDEKKIASIDMIYKLLISTQQLQPCDLIKLDEMHIYYITGCYKHDYVRYTSEIKIGCWHKYLNDIQAPLNVKALRKLPLYAQCFYPLIHEGVATVDHFKNMDIVQFSAYKAFMLTAPWKDIPKTRAYFQKIAQCMPFYIKTVKTVLNKIDTEINRLRRDAFNRFNCFPHLKYRKVLQLENIKEKIDLPLDELEDLNTREKIEDWASDFTKLLVKKINDLANNDEITEKCSYVGYFFKAFVGVVLSACGLFIPLAFTTYRDTFFKTRTTANLQKLARLVETPEHKASSLKN